MDTIHCWVGSLHNTLLFCMCGCSSPSAVEVLEVEQSGRREKLTVRPEEIPPVPENRFLLRRDVPPQEVKAEM